MRLVTASMKEKPHHRQGAKCFPLRWLLLPAVLLLPIVWTGCGDDAEAGQAKREQEIRTALAKANALLEEREPAAAAAVLEPYEDAGRGDVYESIAEAYAADGDQTFAAFYFEQAAGADPALRALYYDAARAYAAIENWEKAAATARAFTDAYPENALGFKLLAEANAERKRHMPALEAYLQAFRLSDTAPTVDERLTVASLFFKMGNYAQAGDWYEDALANAGSSALRPRALLGLIASAYQQQNWEDAQRYIHQLDAIAPDLLDQTDYAAVRDELERWQQTREDLAQRVRVRDEAPGETRPETETAPAPATESARDEAAPGPTETIAAAEPAADGDEAPPPAGSKGDLSAGEEEEVNLIGDELETTADRPTGNGPPGVEPEVVAEVEPVIDDTQAQPAEPEAPEVAAEEEAPTEVAAEEEMPEAAQPTEAPTASPATDEAAEPGRQQPAGGKRSLLAGDEQAEPPPREEPVEPAGPEEETAVTAEPPVDEPGITATIDGEPVAFTTDPVEPETVQPAEEDREVSPNVQLPVSDTTLEEARRLADQGLYEPAIRLYSRALLRQPENARLWYELSRLYLEDNQLENAELMALEALRRNNTNIRYQLNFLRVVQRKYEPSRLMAELRLAKERFPRSPEITIALANGFERILGDGPSALIYYREFLELAPENHPRRDEARQAIRELQ